MGLLVLASGRNLWPVIIGHRLFDASRFVLFYFQGPPTEAAILPLGLRAQNHRSVSRRALAAASKL